MELCILVYTSKNTPICPNISFTNSCALFGVNSFPPKVMLSYNFRHLEGLERLIITVQCVRHIQIIWSPDIHKLSQQFECDRVNLHNSSSAILSLHGKSRAICKEHRQGQEQAWSLDYTLTSLNSTTLFYTTLFYTTLFYTTLFYTTLFYTTLFYTTPFYTTLLYTTQFYTTLFYTTLFYTTLFYTKLLYTTLRCVGHCSAMHCS